MNLITTITLNSFDAKIYADANYSGSIVDVSYIDGMSEVLNNQETAVELAQILMGFDGVVRADIFNKDNNLIFRISSII